METERPKDDFILFSWSYHAHEEVELDVEIKDEEVLSDKEVNKALEEFGEYDPKLDLGRYKHPTIDLMIEYPNSQVTCRGYE